MAQMMAGHAGLQPKLLFLLAPHTKPWHNVSSEGLSAMSGEMGDAETTVLGREVIGVLSRASN